MATGRKQLIKIIILGDAGVGKTSLLHRYVKKTFSDNYKTTIGADFMSQQLTVGSRSVTLQMWDTAGQERFAGLGNAFFRGADGCVLVFDIQNDKSFEALQSWQEAFIQQANCTDPMSFPFIVVGNKIDVGESKRAVTIKKAQQWCIQHNCQYFEASAKDSTNVNAAFEELARLVVAKLHDGLQEAKASIGTEGEEVIRDLKALNEKEQADNDQNQSSGCCS
eukprot:TRINITY_DN3234_c0_g1_i1.p1 TRINITY_DN3234_c0_g1~~TRINITY_DN3234_c0_g1_i1.p1  ORF type:complete len:222 (+),score=38.82 TRINITY_DN3234_c0_g1_i1:100-765(+)